MASADVSLARMMGIAPIRPVRDPGGVDWEVIFGTPLGVMRMHAGCAGLPLIPGESGTGETSRG